MRAEPSPAEQGAVTREEREALLSMRCADGGPVLRGDLVSVPGKGGIWRVAGFDLHRGLVIATSGGSAVRADPAALVHVAAAARPAGNGDGIQTAGDGAREVD